MGTIAAEPCRGPGQGGERTARSTTLGLGDFFCCFSSNTGFDVHGKIPNLLDA